MNNSDVEFDFLTNALNQAAQHPAIHTLLAAPAQSAPLATPLGCTCGGDYATCRCPAQTLGIDTDGMTRMYHPGGL